MTAMVERLAEDFRAFAPELVASPKVSMYRIYRDTRFSENKTPYKTHVAAVFPTRGLLKHEGAGVYFHISPDGVWVGRRHVLAAAGAALRGSRAHRRPTSGSCARSSSPRASAATSGRSREKLTRVPRGFPKDHEAAEYLKHRHFIAGAGFPAGARGEPEVLRHAADGLPPGASRSRAS